MSLLLLFSYDENEWREMADASNQNFTSFCFHFFQYYLNEVKFI